MNKIVQIIFICLFSSSISHAGGVDEAVRDFSEKVRLIIANSDKSSFIDIPCVPMLCSNSTEVIDIVFGGEEETDFERIMKIPELKILIRGPFSIEKQWQNKSYMVIYYDPDKPPFDDRGIISEETGIRDLYKSFLQMIVTVSEGKVSFHRVPFYIGAHHPYVGEYG
ncbi:MAG: hypothetical protein KZQ93_10035 [Candidatus Thiodiazotropha sp. (ex Monitilora ramsayi)]|nr:hypothetical protein [Candidatus Thiodiazotropha sp. (ex Monitilora ramsayi)]